MSQPDMSSILAQAQAMQAKLQEVQAEILASTITGTAGNDLVTATMSGDGTLTAINIDPKIVDPEDLDTLQDLVVGAVNDAHDKLAKFAEQKMGPLSQGIDAMGGGLF